MEKTMNKMKTTSPKLLGTFKKYLTAKKVHFLPET
jgi:hypothetical protein